MSDPMGRSSGSLLKDGMLPWIWSMVPPGSMTRSCRGEAGVDLFGSFLKDYQPSPW
jgi:hypothetical protein